MKVGDWCYEEDGVVVYRASSFGRCVRGLVAARLGETPFPPGEQLQKHMDESSAAEEEALREYENRRASKVIWQQKSVDLELLPNVIIRGHIDGLDQQSDEVLEVKSFSKSNFEKYDNGGLDGLGALGMAYRWQAAIYGYALERNVRFVIYNKQATGADDLIIIEPPIEPDELLPMDKILERLNFIEEHAALDVLPDCTQKCTRYDMYGHVHEFAAVNVERHDSDLAQMLAEYDAVKVQMDELDEKKTDLREKILEGWGVGTHVAGMYQATVAQVNSSRVDTGRLKKNFRDIYEACLVPTSTTRLTVKKAKGEG